MHSYEMGRTRSEELRKKHGQKINDSDVPVIRQRFEDGETYEAISMDYPITKGSVRDICRGVSYKHIPLVGSSRRRRYTRNLPPNADRSKLGHCDDERSFQDYVRSLSAADLYQLTLIAVSRVSHLSERTDFELKMNQTNKGKNNVSMGENSRRT